MSNKLISAEFHGEPINIIEHSGKRWLTSDAVGKCLGYTTGEERRAILKLYKRHRDEFTEQDTEVVNLATPGGVQQTRIFSDTGCIKLGFFAKTKIGKEFRNFVSDKLATANMEAALYQPAQRPGQIDELQARHAREELLKVHTAWAAIIRYRDKGLTQEEIALLTWRSVTTLRKDLKRMAACGIIQYAVNPLLSAAGKRGNQKRLSLIGGNQNVH